MSAQSILFELGTEELPAGEYELMANTLASGVASGLGQHGLTIGAVKVLATARRLSVLIEKVEERADDTEQEILGPPVAAARADDGSWTPAAIGFAKKQGMSADELQIIQTEKGDRLGIRKVAKGALCTDVLPAVVSQAVDGIPVSKRMRWGRERHEFLRPVQWLVLLYGAEAIDVSLFGLSSGRISRGHRFHGQSSVTIPHADAYEATLREQFVIASVDERKALIKTQITQLASNNERVIVDENLLAEVTGLVEWPVALRGGFDESFLSVPRQALISSMREHQKYFHIESPDGDLLPSFITISNIESKRPESVIYGNEKVIRPRLADAAFFFDTDKETTLASKARRLESVLFQRDLGTLAQKQARISAVAQTLSEYLGADKATIEAAGGLIKADLVSDMVGEFPELQGIAGRHYALHDGESEAVANAIEQHYWPKFSGDRLPESPESAALALADRLDTLIGIFGIGQVPTGSKDPFALRRASLAVIRILLSFAPTVSLEMILRAAKGSFPSDVLDEGVVDAVKAYLLDRLPAHYEEQGVSVDILRSATAVGTESIGDIDRRSLAVAGFAGSEAATALAAANKRVANILTKTEEALPSVDETLLSEAAECSLHAALAESQAALNAAIADNDYSLALSNLAKLRDPVDAFFDNVLVNAEDANVRLNRLALLQELRGQFLKVADLAVLAR